MAYVTCNNVMMKMFPCSEEGNSKQKCPKWVTLQKKNLVITIRREGQLDGGDYCHTLVKLSVLIQSVSRKETRDARANWLLNIGRYLKTILKEPVAPDDIYFFDGSGFSSIEFKMFVIFRLQVSKKSKVRSVYNCIPECNWDAIGVQL